jgi:dTDP-4-dehydrorhamnose reductase
MPMSFKLIVGDIDEEKGQKLVNNALIGAAHHDFHKINLTDIEGTADLLRPETPAVVINCTVMHNFIEGTNANYRNAKNGGNNWQ